jgi:hypothetical protein
MFEFSLPSSSSDSDMVLLEQVVHIFPLCFFIGPDAWLPLCFHIREGSTHVTLSFPYQSRFYVCYHCVFISEKAVHMSLFPFNIKAGFTCVITVF